MKKSFGLTGLLLCLGLAVITSGEPAASSNGLQDNALHITIIYDNYQADPSLQPDWGFACMVEYQGEQLLFDTGAKEDVYKYNAGLLGVNPEVFPTLFISHWHGDHTAGIPWVTGINPSIKCYLPASFFNQLKASGQLPDNSTSVNKPIHMYGPFYSTGEEFEAFREQGLVVKTENGGVLITGCGHPGVVDMVSKAEDELGIQIHTVVGGLHLLDKSASEVEQIASDLSKMGVRKICPTHCTGDRSIAVLKASFGDGYIPGGTGKEIVIN
jgi:7,8-dihydropterin-6-yl-methyl-4-(beta-D-ribofuranosyl)aminobenzene 5'-phosphate synthase